MSAAEEGAGVVRELRGLLIDAQTLPATRTVADTDALNYVIESAARRGASQHDLDYMRRGYPMLADRIVRPKRRRRWLLGRRAPDRLEGPPRYEQLQLPAVDDE
jgi:hypothetical protein